jgi:hypothetical protein
MHTKASQRSEHAKRKAALFASDPDPWHNAYLDRVPMPWCLYADGYRKAATLLVERCETFYDRNTLIYSIAFLYRQYVELALKDFILDGNEVIAQPYLLPKDHRLDQLWSICKKIIRERRLPMLPIDTAAIERGIREFSKFDPTSEAFRYPVDKQGAPSAVSASTSLSIRGLAQGMDELAAGLRKLDGLLGADIGLEREFRHEFYPGP